MRLTKRDVSTKGHWISLASLLPALAFARSSAQLPYDRPGPVVVDVRGRFAVGFPGYVSLGAEPEVLFLWPNGRGIGVDLGFDAVGFVGFGGSGGLNVADFGLKYAVMRRIGNGPSFYKTGAGASLLADSYEYAPGTWKFKPGARVSLEGGLSPVAAGRVAFPVEGVLTVEFYGSGGAQLSLGLSVGTGWVFAGR